jgi:hypothetical protein
MFTAPDLARTDDEPVGAHVVAERTEPVPVERRTDPRAIGEDECCRPIPRLDEARVVAGEVADVRRDRPSVLPRLRDEHRLRMTDVAATVDEQLEDRIELR